MRESLTAGGDRVTRTEVRSPVRGSVKQILVNTVGGVVKPGEAIMDIVPMDETFWWRCVSVRRMWPFCGPDRT